MLQLLTTENTEVAQRKMKIGHHPGWEDGLAPAPLANSLRFVWSELVRRVLGY
jgi:hypothetical protein